MGNIRIDGAARTFRVAARTVRRPTNVSGKVDVGAWPHDSLLVALEAIGAAALVVDEAGNVKGANRAWQRRSAENAKRARAEIARSLRNEGAYCVHVLNAAGEALHFLLVLRDLCPDEEKANACVDRVAGRYRLTPGQTRVLRLVVTGASNRAVATQLGISARTVELHVTAILRALDAESRAMLIAMVLSQ